MPLILFDGLCVFFAFFIALAFRFDGHIPPTYLNAFVRVIPVIILLYGMMNFPFGLYGHLWRYASAQEVGTITGSTATSTALLLTAMLLTGPNRPIPLSVVILSGFFTAGAFTTVRYRQRLLTGMISRLQRVVGSPDRQRVLIVGAGEAGQFMARQIRTHSRQHCYELVGFVDDNPAKLGMRVHGASVLGNREAIPQLTAERNVGLIIIAIHNLSGPTLRKILSRCLTTQARVKMMPNFLGPNLLGADPLGKMSCAEDMLSLKNITPADLLGRQPHHVDETACHDLLAGKVVLVTGAAGSIGSELCRQLLNWQPRRLLMLDNNETGLHDLALTFKYHQTPDSNINQFSKNFVPIVADISNQTKIDHVFQTYQPQIVFHAAAYKHVPLMEQQPDEAVRVNILGTKIVSEAAARYACQRFVLISTDKAINPSSIMGATKRLGEMLITNMKTAGYQASPGLTTLERVKELTNGPQRTFTLADTTQAPYGAIGAVKQKSNGNGKTGWPNGLNGQTKVNGSKNGRQQTRFTAVRFGNVLGSRGSVVPTFTRQIEQGGPVTITHPEMTRYFMTISEAVSLVIQAAALTEGNDIFMLDMGQEIRITDLAHKMIRLRGLRPGKDIAIEYIGTRPGEKFHEELLAPQEEQLPTSHPKIFRIRTGAPAFSRELFLQRISDLIELSRTHQRDKMIAALWQLTRNGKPNRGPAPPATKLYAKSVVRNNDGIFGRL